MPVESRVGPYRILRKIKQGGQGSVYLGYDSRLHRRVAIKIYTVSTDRSVSGALLREARLVAGIQSSRVVQVHDVITSRGHLAMIMEYVPGTDLEHFLQHARPSLASVLSVAADLAAGLAAVRQQRIVHGDLKASNVLIGGNGRVMLTDFGISQGAILDSVEERYSGSLSAISPEQYLGEALDIRSDLFSLGCLMYRMLTGCHPFLQDGHFEASRLIEDEPQPMQELPPPALELPSGLTELVSGLLQKQPRDRPGNTHQVRQALRSIAREVPLSTGDSLLLEARDYFRAEMPEELPPRIPPELAQRGRSRLQLSAEDSAWSWRNPQARPQLAAVAAFLLAVIVAAAALGVQYWQTIPTRVHIAQPDVQVDSAANLPPGFSVDWLLEQVKEGVSDHLGKLFVTGPMGATPIKTIYAPGRSPALRPPREELSIGLHCSAEFCLLRLRRKSDGLQYSDQMVMPAGASMAEWRVAISRGTNLLFRQPGIASQ